MKRVILLVLAAMLLLSACGGQREETVAAVEAYNAAVESYMEEITPYNDAITVAHEELSSLLEQAKALLEGEISANDPATMETLQSAMVEAANLGKSLPEPLPRYKSIEIPEKANSQTLEQLAAKAAEGLAMLEKAARPADAPVPDYAATLEVLRTSLAAAEDSVQLQKQIAAPEDAFVMERLSWIETVTAMVAVTPENDPNQMLNAPGGYIGCIYFSDSRVNRKTIGADDDASPIQIGFVGGGAIEIFATVEDAKSRDEQLKLFENTTQHTAEQTSYFEPGAHGVIGSIVIRTSNALSEAQQAELLAQIMEALQAR